MPPYKKIKILCLLLMGIPFSVSLATTEASLATSLDHQMMTAFESSGNISVTSTESQKTKLAVRLSGVEAPIFGIGKRKYNQRRIQRQNNVDNTNRRARRNQRKNGIGMLPVVKWEEVSRG